VSKGARAGDERATRGDATRGQPELRRQNHVGTQNVGMKRTTTTALQSYTTAQHSTAQHTEAQRRSTSQQHIAAAQHLKHSTESHASMPGERANTMASSPDPELQSTARSGLARAPRLPALSHTVAA
jgi:hypothetical protein